MKRAMRWHDFGSGCEARRSQYREYWQGERQCHGPKLVPARRVAAKTGGTPQRGAGAPLAGMRPRRRAPVLRIMARSCPAPGSHPSMERLEPAPPCAGHFVGRLDHAPRTRSRAAWCGQGREAACGMRWCPGAYAAAPANGPAANESQPPRYALHRPSRQHQFWQQRTRVSLC